MPNEVGRRQTLQTLGWGMAGAVGLVAGAASARGADAPLTPDGAEQLRGLMDRLARAPRRRRFDAVPMILQELDQWDHEALTAVLSYGPATRQCWDVTEIGSPWLDLIRNALNAQVWSFRHPDFLAVAVCHGTAQLALYDQATWDRYRLARLAGDRFPTNTLIEPRPAGTADPGNFEDPDGAFSPADDSIPALMRRGVVFMSCHNAIWEQAATLIRGGVNPDGLSHPALAAELTNHLIPGAVLTPGATGTLPELQAAGFHYIR